MDDNARHTINAFIYEAQQIINEINRSDNTSCLNAILSISDKAKGLYKQIYDSDQTLYNSSSEKSLWFISYMGDKCINYKLTKSDYAHKMKRVVDHLSELQKSISNEWNCSYTLASELVSAR